MSMSRWKLAVLVLVGALRLQAVENVDVQQAWRLADEARDLARAGEGDRSLEVYGQALELAPDVMAIRRDYATVLGWMGHYEAASREFGYVFDMQPEQPVWAVQEMANAHFFGGDDEGALDGFDRLIRAGYGQEANLTRRGLTLLRLGRLDEAEEQYRQALALYPDFEPAAVGLARAMARAGRPESAHSLAVTWGANASPDSEIRLVAAEMLSLMERHDEALTLFAAMSPERLAQPDVAALRSRSVESAGARPTQAASSAAAQGEPLEQDAWAETLREEGVRRAREGEVELGVKHLQLALSIQPDNADFLRDYAIVLGWAERYPEALAQYDRLLEIAPDQPIWARVELARAQLFGDRPMEALETLDGLLAEGFVDATTLSRKGLALRWLGRSGEAAHVYRRIVRDYPDSPDGPRGLVQALADRNRLGDAIEAADAGIRKFPDDWEIRLRKAQALNWAGRHVSARKTLSEAPAEESLSGDVLHHRTLAARWASRPKEAFELALRYRERHPTDPQSRTLLRDLSYEYGASAEAEAEALSDSAGYSYRGVAERIQAPLSPGHRIGFTHGYRRYEDRLVAPGAVSWNRYAVDWSGNLGKRVTTSASVGQIRYGLGVSDYRFTAEGAVSAVLTDKVRVAAGGGIVPGETLPALRQRLTADSVWAEVDFRPTVKLEVSGRYATLAFEDSVTRRTGEFSAFQRVSQRGGHQVRLGVRSQWMRHNRPSALFWSPASFHTQLAALRLEGSLPAGFDYAGEVGTGLQREAGFGRQNPFVSTVEVAKRIKPNLWFRFRGGYSNSSLDRLNPGAASYQFRYLNLGLDFRFKGWG